MAFPEYEEVECPLLCLLYSQHDNGYQMKASDTYKPLADHFHLSESEKTELRKDGWPAPLWNNMVQWARRKLNDSGYLEDAPRGVWKLSEAGVIAAQHQCG